MKPQHENWITKEKIKLKKEREKLIEELNILAMAESDLEAIEEEDLAKGISECADTQKQIEDFTKSLKKLGEEFTKALSDLGIKLEVKQ